MSTFTKPTHCKTTTYLHYGSDLVSHTEINIFSLIGSVVLLINTREIQSTMTHSVNVRSSALKNRLAWFWYKIV